MKLSVNRRNRGIAFTLVELLVVIAIIAILAGVIVAGTGSVLRMAKRTKANSTAVQIQTAVQSYYTEYSVYPTADAGAAATDDFYTGQAAGMAAWQNMMYALCGNIDPMHGTTKEGTITSNTRSIAYLSPTRGDMDANGVLQNPFGSGETSSYFYMVLDTDYSGVVGDSSTTKLPDFTASPTNYMGAVLASGTPGGVAIWCPCDQPVAGGTAAHPSPSSFWAHTY
jgi:prepilin-type N-terminal cleavage/methylation domain-containing protein